MKPISVANSSRALLLGFASVLSVTLCAPALAEKADREKEVEIVYDKMIGSDLTLATTTELMGNVVITQGTLKIQASRVIAKRDKDDNLFAELFGAAGKPVTFRVKRDGKDEYINGNSVRGEFDQKANTVKLFTEARIESGGSTITGDYVYYNTETEAFEVTGTAGTVGSAGGQRGRLVIQPKSAPAKAPDKK